MIAKSPALSIDHVKRSVIKAVLSDDMLFEHLVLKGGNAIDIIHQITARASVDIDFSMPGDFPGGAEALLGRLDAYRDFHRADFAAVQATMSPDIVLETFDTYFDFTLDLVKRLQPLRYV